MSEISIHGSEYAIGKVFGGDFTFKVPLYQRPYSWSPEQADELLDDFVTFIKNQADINVSEMSPYFLGSTVLIKKDNALNSEIVDGQQRLATLTILLSALRQVNKEMDAEDDAHITKFIYEAGNKYEGTFDHYRLTLRGKDSQFFQEYIQEPGGILKIDNLDYNTLSDAQINICDNARFFLNRLREMKKVELERLGSFIITKCYLVVVTTPDRDSAYRIFSVLNDRGLDLTTTDILKAEIIGQIQENQQDKYAEKWDNIEELLGRDIFQDLFAHIRMIHRKMKSQAILKEIRDYILPETNPQSFIDDILEPYSNSIYVIKNAKYQHTNIRPNNDRSIFELNALFTWLNKIDNSDWYPPTILYFSRYWNKVDKLLPFFIDIERLAASLMIRRANINQRVERYSKLLTAIEQGDDLYANNSPLQLNYSERRATLRNLNSDDFYTLRNVPRYVLLRLDSAISEGIASYEYPVITVEHVLPQNPPANSMWNEWFPSRQDHKKNVNRIGNLVLLSRKKNSRANNYEFKNKKKVYFANKGGVTPFVLTTRVLENDVWTPDVIEMRQREMIEFAKSIWRL